MPASAPPRPLDLKRHLLARVCLFALVVLLLGSAAALLEARHRVRSEIELTGLTISHLVNDRIARSGSAYSRMLTIDDLDLKPLQPIGKLVNFCLGLTDIYSHDVGQRCFAEQPRLPAALPALMRAVIGADAVYQGMVGSYPGITAGQLTVTPNYGSELVDLAGKLGQLLALSIMILLLSFFVYRPVRNALAPSEAILDTLARMEAGDLRARMPAFALIELNRIGAGFNHLVDRLEQTSRDQQRLAHRLLSVREEERAHLARELHDEFGQYLASLNAEAAYARELAEEGVPALLPCAESIGNTCGHMMEVLQQILHRLRPIGLAEFGLLPSLRQLIDGWNARCYGRIVFTLEAGADPALDALADDLNVSVYRIVQESITNAVRHGRASQVAIALRRAGADLLLDIADDGQGAASTPTPQKAGGGFGLLGMEERVLALGGSLSVAAAPGGGTVVKVRLPLAGSDGGRA
jgi:two-component system, NarL family, sensor histidine kinase UhpB